MLNGRHLPHLGTESLHALRVFLPAAPSGLELVVCTFSSVVFNDSSCVSLVLERIRWHKIANNLALGALLDPFGGPVAADAAHGVFVFVLVLSG